MNAIKPGGVLCMDLSSVVGIAVGSLTDRLPAFETWRLPKIGGEGARYAAFENTLAQAIEAWEPSWIVLEAPIPLPAMNNRASAFQQITLRGIAYSEAYRASIPISEIDAYTARLEVMGVGRPAEGKKAVVAWCRAHGMPVGDDHAGDACVLWLWHRRKMRNGSAAEHREGARG